MIYEGELLRGQKWKAKHRYNEQNLERHGRPRTDDWLDETAGGKWEEAR